MRVLFVDDEPRVLDGLGRMLFGLDREWETRFATSATEAMALLAEWSADVVVCDMRMPGMDGAGLLRHVQARHPGAMRILLSSHTDQEAAFRALGLAHQFLSKPCAGQVLVDAIERFECLQRMLQSAPLQRLIGRVDRLPPAPRICLELWRTLSDNAQGTADAAAIIGKDPALALRVLHLANSALMWRGSPIEDIRSAVARIGVDSLRTLVLASEALGGYGGSMAEALQQRALRASLFARRLAPSRVAGEIAATAALLADVALLVPGVPVLCEEARAAGAEITHAEVSAYLLGLWGLPSPIVEAVAHHHAPGRVPQHEFGPIAMVHVAVSLAAGAAPDAAFLTQLGMADRIPVFESQFCDMCGESDG